MDYLHTPDKYMEKMVALKTQSSQSVVHGVLKKYDSFGVILEVYRLKGERPKKFFPWHNVDNIEECDWQDDHEGA